MRRYRGATIIYLGICLSLLTLCFSAEAASHYLVPAGPNEGRIYERALVRARSDVQLKRLSELFLASSFDRCVTEALVLENNISAVLLVPDAQDLSRLRSDLSFLKSVNNFLGLCHAALDHKNEAMNAFARADRLQGAPPDARLFSPAMKELYQRAEKLRNRRCSIDDTDYDQLWIDGKAISSGESVEVGEHYIVVALPSGEKSGRALVDVRCGVRFSGTTKTFAGTKTRDWSRLAISTEEISDRGFLERVGAETRQYVLKFGDGLPPWEELKVYHIRPGVFRTELIATSVPTSDPVKYGRPNRGSSHRELSPTPWYQRWWVWAVIGVGVAAAITIPTVIVATQYEPYKIVF